jgi:hypothetical protein
MHRPVKMAFINTCNFVPDLENYLDANVNGLNAPLVIICQICRNRRLTISALAQSLIASEEGLNGCTGRLELMTILYSHGFEQTVVFPCGHVFGDRCVRERFHNRSDLTCPSCGFKMTYKRCDHAIAPAVIPVRYSSSVRDTFPLTIPEGGQEPRHCKECRWEAARAKLRYALDAECVICAMKASTGIPVDPKEHNAHRAQHVKFGVREAIAQVMELVQPEFITRESKTTRQMARDEKDTRDINAALLHATAMTELDDTIWCMAGTNRLTKEQVKRHAVGVQAMENWVLGLLMDSGNSNCRRMW